MAHASNAVRVERDDTAPVAIVVGLDRTDAARHALDYAIGAARRTGGRVIAAHVQKLLTPAASLSLLTPAALRRWAISRPPWTCVCSVAASVDTESMLLQLGHTRVTHRLPGTEGAS